MQAVVLAGGKGTRFKGGGLQKVTAPINSKALITHTIDGLCNNGVSEVLVVTSVEPQAVKKAVSASNFNGKVKIIHQEQANGTSDAVWRCSEELENTFLLYYGDIYSPKWQWLNSFTRQLENEVHVRIGCQPSTHPYETDLLNLGAARNITSGYRLNSSFERYINIANAAVALVSKDVVMSAKPKQVDFFNYVLGEKNIEKRAELIVSPLLDIGTPGRYQRTLLRSPEQITSTLQEICVHLNNKMSTRDLVFEILEDINLNVLFSHQRFNLVIRAAQIAKDDAITMIKEIDYLLSELSSLFVELSVVCETSGNCYGRI